MKIRITFDLSTEERRAIAWRMGYKRPATRTEIVSEIEGQIRCLLDVLSEIAGEDQRTVQVSP